MKFHFFLAFYFLITLLKKAIMANLKISLSLNGPGGGLGG